jgi:hypothetical protein
MLVLMVAAVAFCGGGTTAVVITMRGGSDGGVAVAVDPHTAEVNISVHGALWFRRWAQTVQPPKISSPSGRVPFTRLNPRI